eukprot:scaffold27764_cov40-Prasinocladus_malaysianus.AAC.3
MSGTGPPHDAARTIHIARHQTDQTEIPDRPGSHQPASLAAPPASSRVSDRSETATPACAADLGPARHQSGGPPGSRPRCPWGQASQGHQHDDDDDARVGGQPPVARSSPPAENADPLSTFALALPQTYYGRPLRTAFDSKAELQQSGRAAQKPLVCLAAHAHPGSQGAARPPRWWACRTGRPWPGSQALARELWMAPAGREG